MQTIGKYQVLRVLGQGGMGTVYEALDPHIKRRVAIKTMTPGLTEDGVLRERFLREAQAAGGLRHRNIVTVYDLGEDGGQPYIAMELVEGTDLEAIIRKRVPVSLDWKVDVLRQVCQGLAHAHRFGIIHRDVKPANIRLTSEGEVKIVDFGIAHLQSSTMTRGGQVLGTVHYMAPEQVDGRKVDHRADIFSVGAIAYELLSYKRPFDSDSITNVLLKITQETPDVAALPRTELSPELERIVMRALARELGDRYASLEEMLEDLGRLGRKAPHGREEEAARSLLLEAEADALQRRVEKELGDIRADAARARDEGRLQQALGLCRKVLEMNPEDEEAARMAGEIETAVHERDIEQLSGMALAYAADGDMDLALKIADRIGRLAPASVKARQLRVYLIEERARRTADALVATAQEHLVFGNLDEARAAAEEALAAYPSHAVAREIRDRAGSILATRRSEEARLAGRRIDIVTTPPEPESEEELAEVGGPEPLPENEPPARVHLEPQPVAEPEAPALAGSGPGPTAEAAPASPAASEPASADAGPAEVEEVAALTPLPEGAPRDADAARHLDGARRLLRERAPEKALPLLEEAARLDPDHAGIKRLLGLTRIEARKAQAEALTTAALDHFVHSQHRKARAVVDQALALEPSNRKAQELRNVLAALLS